LGLCAGNDRRTLWWSATRVSVGVRQGWGVVARLDAGAIVDEVVAPDGRTVSVRFERCPAGWQAAFELSHPEVDDVTVVHRLVAETLPQARESVPQAIAYLLGTPSGS